MGNDWHLAEIKGDIDCILTSQLNGKIEFSDSKIQRFCSSALLVKPVFSLSEAPYAISKNVYIWINPSMNFTKDNQTWFIFHLQFRVPGLPFVMLFLSLLSMKTFNCFFLL